MRDPEVMDVSTFYLRDGLCPPTRDLRVVTGGTVPHGVSRLRPPPPAPGSIAVSVTDEQGNTVNGFPSRSLVPRKPRIQVLSVQRSAVWSVVERTSPRRPPTLFPDTPISLRGRRHCAGDTATTSTFRACRHFITPTWRHTPSLTRQRQAWAILASSRHHHGRRDGRPTSPAAPSGRYRLAPPWSFGPPSLWFKDASLTRIPQAQ